MKQRPKRRIRQTAWGNWRGYEGRRWVIEFANTPTTAARQAAKDWLKEEKRP